MLARNQVIQIFRTCKKKTWILLVLAICIGVVLASILEITGFSLSDKNWRLRKYNHLYLSPPGGDGQ